MKNFKLLAFVFSLTLSTAAMANEQEVVVVDTAAPAASAEGVSAVNLDTGTPVTPEGLTSVDTASESISSVEAPKTSMFKSASDLGSKAFDTAKTPFVWVNGKIQNNPKTTAAIVIATVAAAYVAYKYNSNNDKNENEDEQN